MFDLLAQLWAKVDKTGTCWLWQGSTDKNGYPLLRIEGKTKRVARVLWSLLHDVKLRESEHVLHRCDTPACLNPEHLFVGSHAQNMADMAAKGRSYKPTGAVNGRALLTFAQAQSIRTEAAQGASHSQLADKYNVSRGAVYHVLAGRTWN